MAAWVVFDERSGRTHEATEFPGTNHVRESGRPIGDFCRQLGGRDATLYAWKKEYAHLGVSKLRIALSHEGGGTPIVEAWLQRLERCGLVGLRSCAVTTN